MKKFISLALSGLLVFAMAACGGGTSSQSSEAKTSTPASKESTAAPAAGDKMVFGMAMNALDEFQTEWLGYFQGYMEGLGHEVIVTNAEGKVDKQIADIEALIQKKPDVILIRSVDPEGLVPAFEACKAAGIPSIDSDFGIEYEETVHLSSSQTELGRLQGEWCNSWLEANPDEEIRAGYLIGVQFGAAWDRYTGWKEEIENGKYADRFTIQAEKVCNWSATESMAAVEDWITAHPDMNTIVAMSDEMAIAAINVVEAAGKSKEINILGLDGSPNAQVHIRDGSLVGSSFIPRKELAEKTADYAIEVAQGKDYVGQKIDIGDGYYAFLTKENIEAELAKYA